MLFFHGREAYRRNAYSVCYMFYKNIMLAVPVFMYGIYSVFSGTMIYSALLYSAYNTFYTAAPIIWFATEDFEYPK